MFVAHDDCAQGTFHDQVSRFMGRLLQFTAIILYGPYIERSLFRNSCGNERVHGTRWAGSRDKQHRIFFWCGRGSAPHLAGETLPTLGRAVATR